MTKQHHSSCDSSWYASYNGAYSCQILFHTKHRYSPGHEGHLWCCHWCLQWIQAQMINGLEFKIENHKKCNFFNIFYLMTWFINKNSENLEKSLVFGKTMLNPRMCNQCFLIFKNFVANSTLYLCSSMDILNVSFDMSIFLETFATHLACKYFLSNFIATNGNMSARVKCSWKDKNENIYWNGDI